MKKNPKRDYKLRVRGELKKKIFLLLMGKKCSDCGWSDPLALTFSFARGKRVSAIGTMVNDCKPWDKIDKEIQKCEILCMNCNFKRTAKRLNFWKQLKI